MKKFYHSLLTIPVTLLLLTMLFTSCAEKADEGTKEMTGDSVQEKIPAIDNEATYKSIKARLESDEDNMVKNRPFGFKTAHFKIENKLDEKVISTEEYWIAEHGAIARNELTRGNIKTTTIRHGWDYYKVQDDKKTLFKHLGNASGTSLTKIMRDPPNGYEKTGNDTHLGFKCDIYRQEYPNVQREYWVYKNFLMKQYSMDNHTTGYEITMFEEDIDIPEEMLKLPKDYKIRE